MLMPMPEAAVDKDHQSMSGKHDIRLTGKVRSVEPETVTHSMKQLPDPEFRTRVLAPNTGHICASCRGREAVHLLRPLPLNRYPTALAPRKATCVYLIVVDIA